MRKVFAACLAALLLVFIVSCENAHNESVAQNDDAVNNVPVNTEPSESIFARRLGDAVMVFYGRAYDFDYNRSVRYEYFLPEHRDAIRYQGRLVFSMSDRGGREWDGLSYYIGKNGRVGLIRHESGDYDCGQPRCDKICVKAEDRWQRWNTRFIALGMKQMVERESAQPFKVYFGEYPFNPPD
jgi:hypothetical protein